MKVDKKVGKVHRLKCADPSQRTHIFNCMMHNQMSKDT